MTLRLRTLALAVLALLLLGAAAAGLGVYFGLYNIAATEQHTRPVFALLDYAMRRAAIVRGDMAVPPDLQQPARIARGLAHYRRHCLQCHGAPGVAPDPLAFGLTPAPANLVGTARHWRPGELFWVVKHGIKMTGMPAWAYRLHDDEIWDVVAFVEAMARLTPRQYEAMAAADAGVQRQAHQAPGPVQAGGALGDARAGRRAAERHLCATCHLIPGFVGARQHVGPPLSGIAGRSFIAGILPNTPENMVRWLVDPRAIDPLSAMPVLGLSEQDARDIAAYLYTLDRVSAK